MVGLVLHFKCGIQSTSRLELNNIKTTVFNVVKTVLPTLEEGSRPSRKKELGPHRRNSAILKINFTGFREDDIGKPDFYRFCRFNIFCFFVFSELSTLARKTNSYLLKSDGNIPKIKGITFHLADNFLRQKEICTGLF